MGNFFHNVFLWFTFIILIQFLRELRSEDKIIPQEERGRSYEKFLLNHKLLYRMIQSAVFEGWEWKSLLYIQIHYSVFDIHRAGSECRYFEWLRYFQDAALNFCHAERYRRLRGKFGYEASYAENCSNSKAVSASAKRMKNFLLFCAYSPQICFYFSTLFLFVKRKMKNPL